MHMLANHSSVNCPEKCFSTHDKKNYGKTSIFYTRFFFFFLETSGSCNSKLIRSYNVLHRRDRRPQTTTPQPNTKQEKRHGDGRSRRRAERHRHPVRDPQHGPRDAGAGLRHGLVARAVRPGRHHRPPRLPPPRHRLLVRHGADGGRSRRRGCPARCRGVPRRPVRDIQAVDRRREAGPRRPCPPRVARPPRPGLPRPLPRSLPCICCLRRRQDGAVRHGGRVARHGGVPPPGPRAVRRRQQLLVRQDVEAARHQRRAAGRQPGGNERRVEAGEGQGDLLQERRRGHRLLAAGRVRRVMGLRHRHGERRPPRHRRCQRQDGSSGGAAVAVRAGSVHGGEELQQGEDGAEHGDLLGGLGAQRREEGGDRDGAAEEGVPGGGLCTSCGTARSEGLFDFLDYENTVTRKTQNYSSLSI